jgi:hypothetical protein
MGLRVVRDDGGPIGFRQALVRGLAGAFLERPGITLFVAGVVTSLLNSTGKRLGDLLAGTVVLQERVPARGGTVAQMPPQLAGWAAGLDLSGLPDDLALQARQFLSRSSELTPEARDQLGGRLVAAVSDAVQPPPPPGTPGWAVLSAVLAERRRREEVRLGQRRGRARRRPRRSPRLRPAAGATARPRTARPGTRRPATHRPGTARHRVRARVRPAPATRPGYGPPARLRPGAVVRPADRAGGPRRLPSRRLHPGPAGSPSPRSSADQRCGPRHRTPAVCTLISEGAPLLVILVRPSGTTRLRAAP